MHGFVSVLIKGCHNTSFHLSLAYQLQRFLHVINTIYKDLIVIVHILAGIHKTDCILTSQIDGNIHTGILLQYLDPLVTGGELITARFTFCDNFKTTGMLCKNSFNGGNLILCKVKA